MFQPPARAESVKKTKIKLTTNAGRKSLSTTESTPKAPKAAATETKTAKPKTKKKEDEVIVAYITFTPDIETKQMIVKATYAPIVIGYDTIVYDYHVPIEVKGETIVVVDTNPFYGWLFLVSRPVYVGVYIYTAPPPPVIIIHHGWHHKHKHKGKWKGKGKWH